MHEVLTWLQDNANTIGGYAGFGAVIAVAVQSIKVKFHIDQRYIRWLKLDGPKLANILLSVLTAVPLVAELIIEKLNDDPTQISGNYAYLFVAAIWVHRFAVSPLYNITKQKLEDKQSVKDKAAAYDKIIQAQSQSLNAVTTPSVPIAEEAPAVFDPSDVIQG